MLDCRTTTRSRFSTSYGRIAMRPAGHAAAFECAVPTAGSLLPVGLLLMLLVGLLLFLLVLLLGLLLTTNRSFIS
jgi:hypothetical protein